MAAMLLVGVGSGYFLAPGQGKNSEERLTQTDTKSQELAAANADLARRLASTEEKMKGLFSANVDLGRRLSAAEERKRPSAPDQKVKPKIEPATTKEDVPKAKEPATEKERLVLRLVDDLLQNWMAGVVTNWTAEESRFSNDMVVTQSSRLNGHDETLPMRLAHRFIMFSHDLKVDDPRFERRVKQGLRSMADVQKSVATNGKYLDSLVKSHSELLIAYNRKSYRQEIDDELELKHNAALTPARAADLVRMAAMIQSATTKEMNEIMAQMKQGLVQAVANHPEILERFAEYEQTTDEIRKSRERVRAMLREAANAKQSLASQEPTSPKESPVSKDGWQKTPVAFARLYFGDNLAKRTPKEAGPVKGAKDIEKKVIGMAVEWDGEVLIDVINKTGKKILVVPFSKAGWIWVQQRSIQDQLDSLPLGSRVRITMKLNAPIIPLIAGDGVPVIILGGDDARVTPR